MPVGSSFTNGVGSRDDRQESQCRSGDGNERRARYSLQVLIYRRERRSVSKRLSEWGRRAEAKCQYKIDVCVQSVLR